MSSAYYPMGAEFDPSAPWNDNDPEPVEKEVDYSCTLSRTALVEITDYYPGHVNKEWDEDGYVATHDDDDDNDFSDTNWLEEFKDTYRTPIELIGELRKIAENALIGKMPDDKGESYWMDILADCTDWTVDDEEADKSE